MKYFDNLDPDSICLTPIDLNFTTLNVIWPAFLGHQQIACFQRSLADFPANLGSAQQNIDGAVKLIDHECVNNIDESKTEELAKDCFFTKISPKKIHSKISKNFTPSKMVTCPKMRFHQKELVLSQKTDKDKDLGSRLLSLFDFES